MTPQEEKEVIRVCGPNYEKSDIPTYIRNRDEKEAIENAQKEESRMWAEEHGAHLTKNGWEV